MKIGNIFKRGQKAVSVATYKMVTDHQNGFFSWDGNLYKSDIIRAAIRPKVRAIGKTTARHIRKKKDTTEINPDLYMKFLLEEPNAHMSIQQLLERAITHLELNNNAFIFIERDKSTTFPIGLYPIKAIQSELLQNEAGMLYYKFLLPGGKTYTFKHEDIIHLTKDVNSNTFFGDGNEHALTQLMEIVTTTDQGIVKAIKNSNVVRWLLKIHQIMHDDDIEKATKKFTDSFLSSDSEGGAAAVDGKMDAQQVDPKDYVPNEHQMTATHKRMLQYFNTNEKIITSNYTENDWIAYYETAIEPELIQLSKLFTRKLFTRKQRIEGNEIIFESNNLSFASMATKLALVQFVDRGIMSPNEVREILNYAPAPNGDEFIRRLDTAKIANEGGENK